MEDSSTPDRSPRSVRTPPVVPSCPIYGQALTGKQTVCSGRCRIERWRQRREAKRQEHTAQVRVHIREAQKGLDAALGLLASTEDDDEVGGGV